MRWRAKPERDPKKWEIWRAWYPVEVDGYWVWLDYVERRPWEETGPSGNQYYDYRLVEGRKY